MRSLKFRYKTYWTANFLQLLIDGLIPTVHCKKDAVKIEW